MTTETVIEVKGLKTYLGDQWVHKGIDMTVKKGEIYAIVGGSGSGKTTLLRQILMLNKPSKGDIKVFGTDIVHCSWKVAEEIRQRWGMMFQSCALFGSLTVLENVSFPLKEHADLNIKLIEEIARLKISLVGLGADAVHKYPLELSGGMQKRAALARAIALDPELLFLDEPSSGLDPESANELDNLIQKLQETLGLTIVMVTHDLDTLWSITDRVAFLAKGKLLAEQPIQELVKNPDPIIQDYFSGPRGRAARDAWTQK